MSAAEKVIIKTRLPRYKGKGEASFNAGALTVVFEGDTTKPMPAERAKAFMTAFGHMHVAGQPAFEVLAATAAKPKPTPPTEPHKAPGK